MSRFTQSIKQTSQTAGLAPGTLVHVGEKREEDVRITIIDYDKRHYEEKEPKSIDECLPYKDSSSVTWINIDGVHQLDIIEEIGKHFGIHPLILEDIANTSQTPKMEDLDNYIYIVFNMIYFNETDNEFDTEQVSVVFGKNYVISFQERKGDIFESIRERIKNSQGRIRNMGTDYLSYCLMDAVVDNYFIILEKSGEFLENMEDEVVSKPRPEILQTIHSMKNDMIFLRRSAWPLREVIDKLERGESKFIQKSTRIYLRDVYDHSIQVINAIETYRTMLSGMLDIYFSSVSNRMNEVMKVLTVIATIFIPMTVITGIYGMNFQNMPELKWPWGYFGVLAVLGVIGILMLIFFRKKKWI